MQHQYECAKCDVYCSNLLRPSWRRNSTIPLTNIQLTVWSHYISGHRTSSCRLFSGHLNLFSNDKQLHWTEELSIFSRGHLKANANLSQDFSYRCGVMCPLAHQSQFGVVHYSLKSSNGNSSSNFHKSNKEKMLSATADTLQSCHTLMLSHFPGYGTLSLRFCCETNMHRQVSIYPCGLKVHGIFECH